MLGKGDLGFVVFVSLWVKLLVNPIVYVGFPFEASTGCLPPYSHYLFTDAGVPMVGGIFIVFDSDSMGVVLSSPFVVTDLLVVHGGSGRICTDVFRVAG